MAEENELEIIKVIDEDGKIREGFGAYSGKPVIEAREMIAAKLREGGLIEKEEEMENNLSLCYRCDTPIEPLPSLQWFIDVNKKIPKYGKSIKDLSIEAVKTGVFGREKIRIIPERFEKNYLHWMENLRDWCISRQIWFGHRVPVWCRKHGTVNTKQETGMIELNFRIKEIFDEIKAGRKTVETRALNPEEPDKYFGDIKVGDEIQLNSKRGEYTAECLMARVKSVNIYKNDEDLLENVSIDKILPGRKEEDLIFFHKSIPGYTEKINKNGIVAIELSEIRENKDGIDTYVGVEPPEGGNWTQDTDTLDTWFSSGLWTFSTLAKKPEEVRLEDGKLIIDSDDFRVFHPTSVLETGYDILFFWVARMIIMTTYAVGDIPFRDVYLHGLVRDDQGRKMSKSLGNVIDPLDMCQKYGTDATRLSLVIGTTPGNDMNLSEEKIAGYRNFVNKLWNISRYILQTTDGKVQTAEIDHSKLTLADKWILGKLDALITEATDNLDNYNFSQAGEKLREFTWDFLADWYLEAAKFEQTPEKKYILKYILKSILKLWHPFIPFVTEVIWSEADEGNLLMTEKWPKPERNLVSSSETKFPAGFELIEDIITAIRNARAEHKVEPGRKVRAVIYAGEDDELVKSQEVLIKNLRTGIGELEIKEKGEKLENAIYATAGGIEIYLLGAVDEAKEKERLEKEIANLEKLIVNTGKKLANEEFTSKAPAAVVQKEKDKLAAWREELGKLKERFNLNSI